MEVRQIRQQRRESSDIPQFARLALITRGAKAAVLVAGEQFAEVDVAPGLPDALSDLVAVYEDEHHAIEPAADADMLRHLLDAKGVTQTHLSHETGIAKPTISEVLSAKKPFSRQMIRKLADYFQVDVSILASNL